MISSTAASAGSPSSGSSGGLGLKRTHPESPARQKPEGSRRAGGRASGAGLGAPPLPPPPPPAVPCRLGPGYPASAFQSQMGLSSFLPTPTSKFRPTPTPSPKTARSGQTPGGGEVIAPAAAESQLAAASRPLFRQTG